jgi:O-antigen/teichoic acid export membrane protein
MPLPNGTPGAPGERRRFDRLFRNATTLLTGSAGASVLSIIALALSARGLGAAQLGVLAVIQSYVTVIDRLVTFQSWQALIKYGTDALRRNDRDEFMGLLWFGAAVDAASALLGAVVGVFGSLLVGRWFGWTGETTRWAMVYATTILFHVVGAPTATLRLFDQFRLFSIQRIGIGLIRLSGIALAFATHAPLWAYMAVWIVADVAGSLWLIAMAWRELRRRGFTLTMPASLRAVPARHPGLWNFVWTTNVHSSIRVASREGDTLIVGAVLGEAAAGLFKVAKQFGSAFGQLSDPFYQAIYPEMAAASSAGDRAGFTALLRRSTIIATLAGITLWLGMVIVGGPALRGFAGAEYGGGYPVLVWYGLAYALSFASFAMQPAMLSLGRALASFSIMTLSTAVQFLLLVPLMHRFGVAGAGLAYVAFYVTWIACVAAVLARDLTLTVDTPHGARAA